MVAKELCSLADEKKESSREEWQQNKSEVTADNSQIITKDNKTIKALCTPQEVVNKDLVATKNDNEEVRLELWGIPAVKITDLH